MSIEKDLSRIADALEALVEMAKGDGRVVEGKLIPKKVNAPTPPVEDTVPGVDTPEVGTPVGTSPTGMTSKDLRDMAQKYIQNAGEKTGATVKFMQSVAKIYSPAEPKLIKIPDEKATEAAKMIENWCAKNGVVIPVEV